MSRPISEILATCLHTHNRISFNQDAESNNVIISIRLRQGIEVIS
jgi:hypothetical protein